MPQVEQAQQILQDPGDRLSHHTECRKSAKSTAEFINCMDAAGYEFIPRGLDYPAPECWRLRDAGGDGEANFPQPFCFFKKKPE